MSELKYDPELPYVYELDDVVYGRFKHRGDAEMFEERVGDGRVVDTTPKPKIPEDAGFIYYLDSGGDDQFGHRDLYDGEEIWWTGAGDYISTREILEYIGDGEVTVLVRKEES